MMKRSLGKTNFFFDIFPTFGGYVTNLRGTFVENVKKSKINPPYCATHLVSKNVKKFVGEISHTSTGISFVNMPS
jgi:hypothetical protein